MATRLPLNGSDPGSVKLDLEHQALSKIAFKTSTKYSTRSRGNLISIHLLFVTIKA